MVWCHVEGREGWRLCDGLGVTVRPVPQTSRDEGVGELTAMR